jgi:3-oxoadipyl-CoA thiolase
MRRKAVYIIDAVRTPIGKYGGTLSSVRPDDLASIAIRALLSRNVNVDAGSIEDVILGCTNQAGEDSRNVARNAALLAGLPVSVAGITVNRLCASGLQAIADAHRAIVCGDGDVYIVGGVESMSRSPFVMSKAVSAFSRHTELFDSTLGTRFPNPRLNVLYPPYSNGETAENVARQWGISREAQDEFAVQSQLKCLEAQQCARFDAEIVPVSVGGKHGVAASDVLVDEHPRRTTMEALLKLKPIFARPGETGSVTAGNSSGINDGASALLIASEDAIRKYNLTPMARIVSYAVAGVDPSVMGVGPVPAVLKALSRAQLTMQDIALHEINEAFAVQVLACIRDLDIDPITVNVNGGAISLGHPLGCSGARITTTLVHEMRRRMLASSGKLYGVASMCVGTGQGAAIVLEGV